MLSIKRSFINIQIEIRNKNFFFLHNIQVIVYCLFPVEDTEKELGLVIFFLITQAVFEPFQRFIFLLIRTKILLKVTFEHCYSAKPKLSNADR